MIRFIKPLLFVIVTFVVLFLTDMDERLQRQAEQNAMGKMLAMISASKEMAGFQLQELDRELQLLAVKVSGASANSSGESQIDLKLMTASDFDAVAIYRRPNAEGNAAPAALPAIAKFKTKKSSWNQKWWSDRAKDFFNQNLDVRKSDQSQLVWQRITDMDGQVYFFTKQVVGPNEIRIGVVPTLVFGQLVRLVQDNKIVTFMTNSAGVGFAHNDQNIVGASFQAHGLVNHQLSSQGDAAQGSFRDWDGTSTFGTYSRVPGTNLFVAATIAQSNVVSGLGLEVWFQWVLIAIGVAFFLAALVSDEGQWLITNVLGLAAKRSKLFAGLVGRFAVLKNEKTQNVGLPKPFGMAIRASDHMEPLLDSAGSGKVEMISASENDFTKLENQKIETAAAMTAKPVESSSVIIQNFKWDSEIAKALAICLRQPVTAAVGLIQSGNVEAAEKELRRARQLIESLCVQMNASGNDEWADLSAVVEALEPRVAGQLDAAGVLFQSGLQDPHLVRFDNKHLLVVVSTIFQWLVDRAEERQGLTSVILSPFQVASMAGFDLVVTGINLKPSDADQFFQPFQNRLTSSQFFGLEFLVVETLVKMAGGDLFVEKRKTDQIAFVLRLPGRLQPTKMQTKDGKPLLPFVSEVEL